ncbi:hypothetical protein EYF70_00520 [Pseudoduganella albidiflava]|uniref:Immunity MXAN-0049 protein domain-containing protein n=1 Tax=Pseudoduganella albidiflava TaxID=321983 RepID=A0ABX5RLT1_9BURK|nr:DUF1629 domain-containing protein [Pseudoduganella albidiflava]QBH99487.1 hypothetical protein EYF70_00520 [Pseudoduganella albidiflava]
MGAKPVFILNKKISANGLIGFDFLVSDGGYFISSKFAELIRNIAQNDVQLIEAEVYLNKTRIEEYYIANIKNLVSCVDMGNSTYKPLIKKDPEGPKKFIRYEFIENSLKSHKIVRCKESPRTIVVSEDFKQACISHGIKGVDFLRNGVREYE